MSSRFFSPGVLGAGRGFSAAFAAAVVVCAGFAPSAWAEDDQPLKLNWDSKGPFGIIKVQIQNGTGKEWRVAELKGEFVDKEGKPLGELQGIYSEFRIRQVKADGKEIWYPAPPSPLPGDKLPEGHYPSGVTLDPGTIKIEPGKSAEVFLLATFEKHLAADDFSPRVAVKLDDGNVFAFPAGAGDDIKGAPGVEAVEMKGIDPAKEVNVLSLKKSDGWVIVEFALTNLSDSKLTVLSLRAEFRGGTNGKVRYGQTLPTNAFSREGFTFAKEKSDGRVMTAGGVALASKETRGFVAIGKPTGDAAMVNKVIVQVLSDERGEIAGEGSFGKSDGPDKTGDDDDDDDAKKDPKDPKKSPPKDDKKKPPEKPDD